MKILVMGGTEFVSRNVAEHFIHENYAVDIFTRGKKKVDYSGVNHHYIGDRKNLKDLGVLEDISYDYIIDISAYTQSDVEKLVSTIDRTNLKRYIFCSSGAVYEPCDELIHETFPRGKNHNWLQYGQDKLEAEHYLMAQYEEGLPITIFRPTYIYGPYNSLYRESFFFDRITHNQRILYPKSDHQTQFIHIHDLVLIIQSFMASEKSNGQAYNVTCETCYTFKDILNVFSHATHEKIDTMEIETPEPSRRYFPYRDVNYMLSIDKLRKHQLHIPKFDLKEGLKQTFLWYQEFKPHLSDPVMTKLDQLLEDNK